MALGLSLLDGMPPGPHDRVAVLHDDVARVCVPVRVGLGAAAWISLHLELVDIAAASLARVPPAAQPAPQASGALAGRPSLAHARLRSPDGDPPNAPQPPLQGSSHTISSCSTVGVARKPSRRASACDG